MSNSGLEDFIRIVLNDEALQAQLRDLTEVHEFTRRVVELGAERNCSFTAAEVEEAMRTNRGAWFEKGI